MLNGNGKAISAFVKLAHTLIESVEKTAHGHYFLPYFPNKNTSGKVTVLGLMFGNLLVF